MAKNTLDLLDRRILYELDRNSRQSFKELGKRLKLAKETVAFRMRRLVGMDYIKNFNTIVDVSKLNRFYYKVFYKFHKTTSKIDAQILDFILNNHYTAYLASTEGRYDLVLIILAKDVRDLYKFLIPFREKFGQFVLEQEILTVPSANRFNFRFFYELGDLLQTTYGEEMVKPDIDEKDYIILQALTNNSRVKLMELAKATKLDINTVKYRLKKLRTAGVIKAYTLEVNFEKFGLQHIQINYSLKNHSAIPKMISHVAQHPKSVFSTVMLGKYDLAVELMVMDMAELKQIMNQIKDAFTDDITNQDIFILKEHRIKWFPYTLDEV